MIPLPSEEEGCVSGRAPSLAPRTMAEGGRLPLAPCTAPLGGAEGGRLRCLKADGARLSLAWARLTGGLGRLLEWFNRPNRADSTSSVLGGSLTYS